MQSMKVLRSSITLGIAALALAVVVALALTYIYYNPPGQNKIVTFYTVDAASIQAGDEVRMAGIKVGTVDELSLEADRVRVRTRIRNDAFVGDESQVDVRMLTVVGGYYVNINSIGDTPLDAEPIPLERATMPYNLMQVLADTTKVTENVDPKPINESLNEIQRGLTGTNVEALSAAIDAGNSLMSTIEKQQGQVSAILDVTNEYMRALNEHRDEIAELVRKMSIVTQTLILYGKGLEAQIDGLGEALVALKPVADAYEVHRYEFIEKIRQNQHKFRLFVERNGATVRVLQRAQNLLDRILDAQNSRPALLATDLCIPLPGSAC
ncbi:MlaD family protein [Mycolicibacterium holsaticum]|uniref:Mammalian cell entry protein n=1 Tax=Mycolicibacterium holsaticum TaxID=152142 RepID=A0A1E3RU47_9MYCO|nr:MlaD family protein [Mycolicibacterium holsaticum]ODQ93389.1 mammalian cell entry protein [Mycolicibacterium holsaticum]